MNSLARKIKVVLSIKLIQNALLVASSLLIFCIVAEYFLRTGWFDGLDNPRPIWIPRKYYDIDNEINAQNWAFAQKNPYGFTDIVRDFTKKPGYYRVAILGDSFIWGDGLPYQQAWGHKLARKIDKQYETVEVMNWGYNGWSTLDEFRFFQEHGIQYDVDLLIVGYVSNDPDMGHYKQKHLLDMVFKFGMHEEVDLVDYKRKYLNWKNPIRIFFPNVFDLLASYINNFLTQYIFKDYGYMAWEEKLYSQENLSRYSILLQDFSHYCCSHNIELLFVLTPGSPQVYLQERYNQLIPLLQEAEIEYLNLYPAVKQMFSHTNIRRLWANPANGHPGNLLTTVYADEVFAYLQTHLFSDIALISKKRKNPEGGVYEP